MASIPLSPDAPQVPGNSTEETPELKGFKKIFRPFDKAEWKQFLNWLLIWIVLANIGFATMWFIGAPPRRPEIYAAGAIGLIVRRMPVWVQCVAFLVSMIYSILGFVAGLFNLALGSLIHSIKFFLEINPANSVEYIVGAGLLVTIAALAMWLMRRPKAFNDIRLVLLAILATMTLAKIDGQMGKGMRGHYKRAAVEGTPFVSAQGLAGFAAIPAAGEPKRNLILIMVESLGTPVGNAEMKRMLFARYNTPAIADRFEVKTGNTTYFNSTTAGEMRELCGRWGDYDEVMEEADTSCLPARLAQAGYETRAYHSFTGAFFDRATWYPNIGFQKQQFAEELLARGTRECGGVFPGACDRDVPSLIAQDLKAADKPQFLYWLTVNSHLPVPPGMNLEVDNCETHSAILAADFPMICRQFALWNQMDDAIIREITAADFPETDILIVGDHMPPYYDRHHRSQFAPDTVPYLLLKWKGDGSAKSASDDLVTAQGDSDGADG